MAGIDLLVGADYLYPMSPGLPVVTGAGVAIRDGRILHAGPRRPAGHWQPRHTIDGRDRAVLPGLVNGHTQAADLREEGGRIVIEAVQPERYELAAPVAGITNENRHDAVDMGPAVGQEAW